MFRKRDVLRGKKLDRFVVTLSSGETVSGLLSEHDDTRLVFVDVKLVGEGVAPAEGALYVDRAHVLYMQSVTDAAQ